MSYQNKKIGIMGGTFDPIHYGHLMLAQNALETYELDEIMFVPSGTPWLKDSTKVLSKNKRVQMTGIAIEDKSIEEGLRDTNWIGRMTKLKEKPYVFVDGAHNKDAWCHLAQNLNKYFTNKKIIYIIGVLKDKDYHSMVDILGDTMSCAVAITPNTPRGLDKDILASLLKEKGIATDVADSSVEAVKKALDLAGNEDVVLISGSLSFINDYINIFNYTC